MISVASEFKLVDRGFKDTIILIPGWATDYRIFIHLNLNYNYILPIKFYPFKFSYKLLEFLNKESIDKISLFGWSLGGFLAVEFAFKNLNRVNELILLSIRKKFPEKALEEIKLQLKKNKRAYLYKFYLECFSNNDREGLTWFKKYLLRNYIRQMNLKDLIYGLDYLSEAQISAEYLGAIKKIRIFHGEKDSITPLQEAREIKSHLSGAKFICLRGVGHIPFLGQNFIEEFYNG
jgi:pimeloyl-ACP methyl ester carboxylesterase